MNFKANQHDQNQYLDLLYVSLNDPGDQDEYDRFFDTELPPEQEEVCWEGAENLFHLVTAAPVMYFIDHLYVYYTRFSKLVSFTDPAQMIADFTTAATGLVRGDYDAVISALQNLLKPLSKCIEYLKNSPGFAYFSAGPGGVAVRKNPLALIHIIARNLSHELREIIVECETIKEVS